jgi:hypothetical protein
VFAALVEEENVESRTHRLVEAMHLK